MIINTEITSKYKIAIATPFYDVKGFSPYIASLLQTVKELTKYGFDWIPMHVNSDAYVDRAKNSLLGMFLDSDCTDLFMIDSDLEWDLYGFFKVLLSNNDFVAGSYPIKDKTGRYTSILYKNESGDYIKNDEGQYKALYVSGGFNRYKRSCIQKLWDHYNYDYYLDITAAYSMRTTNLFSCPIINNERMGEDYEFCRKWREIGGEIWCEPDIQFGHWGSNKFDGNYKHSIERIQNDEILRKRFSKIDNLLRISQ